MKRSLRLLSEGWNPYGYIFFSIWGLTYYKRSEVRGQPEARGHYEAAAQKWELHKKNSRSSNRGQRSKMASEAAPIIQLSKSFL